MLGDNQLEKTGVTEVRPKNKETAKSEWRLPPAVFCCKIICTMGRGWKRADFIGGLYKSNKDIPGKLCPVKENY